ncbi:MAG: lytic transglycosylase domain-containing protein [Firmicutes bacterium]|nr:lytic transglycosylase domain-containing protein [Bacillota bacterium]
MIDNDKRQPATGAEDTYDPIIKKWSVHFGVDPTFIKSIVKAESDFNPKAYRYEPALHDASYGLMQILYSTAASLGYKGPADGLFDPDTNIQYGTRYLEELSGEFKAMELVAAAYNGGPGTVKRLMNRYGKTYGAIADHLPRITQSYVPKVMGFYQDFKERESL